MRSVTVTLLLALLSLGASCPPPTPEPPPTVAAVACVVTSEGKPLPDATCEIAGQSGQTNTDGYHLFAVVPLGPQTMKVTKEHYESYEGNYTIVGNADITVGLLPRPPPVVQLPSLRVRGSYFELANGTRWTAIEATDFRLFRRYLDGEDITPVLKQRAELGFNLLRVLGTCHNMFRLYPAEHPTYYDKLKPFAQLLADHGLYLEWTAFADAREAMPLLEHQLEHWAKVGAAFQGTTNVIVELVNENDHPTGINRIATDRFAPLPGLLTSHGSNGSQAEPVRPWWDYETFHTNDASEWWRKVGHNAMELSGESDYPHPSGKPILANENTRPDRDSNLNHFEDAAAGAALLAAGSCFHSDQGRESVLFTGNNLTSAQRWVKGARSVPLAAQGEPYRRRDDLLTPDLLRVYQRGSNDAHIVRIRK